jgi:hypothetical protein
MSLTGLINIIIGCIFIYFVVHFVAIQFVKTWEQRSVYEKIVTIAAIVLLIVFFEGAVSSN